ncbi:hypothetical protein JXL83_03030 [candidate division WOR-3 bacterium]|nr:hypothetical protein [candidate division WOR-3 bacterium]
MDFSDFFQLVDYLNGQEDPEQRQAVMTKTLKNLVSKKKIPLSSKDGTVLFAWIGDGPSIEDKTIYLRTSETGWERDGFLGKYYNGNIRLAVRNFNGTEKVLYKFESDCIWFPDPLNHNVEWDGTTGESMNSRMNSVVFFSSEPSWPNGRTEMFDVEFGFEGFKITVRNWIVIPPDYDRNLSSYPLMLLACGDHYATHFELPSLPAKLMSENSITEFPLIVLVSSEVTESGRPIGKEELFSKRGVFSKMMENYFASFIVYEIESRFRTKRNPVYRTIGGFKEGASFALKTGLNHPEVFSGIVCQSLDEYDPDLTASHPGDSALPPPFIYFDCGESGCHEKTRESSLSLKKKGYKYIDITVFKNQEEKPEEIKSRLRKMFEKIYGRFPLSAEKYYD